MINNNVIIEIKGFAPTLEEFKILQEGKTKYIPPLVHEVYPEEGKILLTPVLGSSFDCFLNLIEDPSRDSLYLPTDIKKIEIKQSQVPLNLGFEFISVNENYGAFKPVKLDFKKFDLFHNESNNFTKAFTDLSVKFVLTGKAAFLESYSILNKNDKLIDENFEFESEYYQTYIILFFTYLDENGNLNKVTKFKIVDTE